MSSSAALIRFWYARLPRSLCPIAPRVASAISDGGWTAGWVRIAAWAPALVFSVGLFVPRSWPGTEVVYTESPLFLALAVALSMLSGTLGVALLVADGVREALSRDVASNLNAVIHVGAGQFVAWLLLGVLVVMLPQFAHLVTEAGVVRMRFLRNRDLRAVGRSCLLAVIYPCLVLMWCQAATVLLRPVFTWSGSNPPVEFVATVGAWWPWLAAVAAGAALARGILEDIVAPRMRLAPEVATLTRDRHASMREAGHAWKRVPAGVRGVLAVVGTTLLLAGLFERFVDGLAASLVIGLLALLVRRQNGWLTGRWADRVRAIPGAVRVAIALGLGYLLASRVLELEWSGTALRAMMIVALLTLSALFVLFPAEDEILHGSRASGLKVWR
jgi:hypothetical protein